MSDFETQDAEVIGVVRGGQQLPRVACRFIPEVDYHRYRRLEREAAQAAEVAEQQARRDRVARVLSAAARAGMGGICVGGAIEGLMDPVFAMVMAGICTLWAAAGLLWGKGRA